MMVSPDEDVPTSALSKNQNNVLSMLVVTADIETIALSVSSVIIMRVRSTGDVITGGVVASEIVSRSHPGINAGGV